MRDAQVLILDEPTAVLTPQETEGLFKVIRSLAESGRSVLFITHKLKEVLAVADSITVMRLGKVVGHTTPQETDEAELAAMMVGPFRRTGRQQGRRQAGPARAGAERPHRSGRARPDRGRPRIAHRPRGRDRRPRRGPGQRADRAGRSRHRPAQRGQRVDPSRRAGPDERQAPAGTASRDGEHPRRPPDRRARPVDADLRQPRARRLRPGPLRPSRRQAGWASCGGKGEHKLTEFDIRANSVDTPVGTLSGGNQQKVVVARELSHGVTQLVASQPTRGLDVGSIEYVHRRIIDERDRGAGVLLVSSELDEVLALGDRIAVMYRGRIIGIVPPSLS